MSNQMIRLESAHTPDTRTLGPFEFVQATYLLLRDDADHDLATYDLKSGYWITPDGAQYTDLILYTAETPTAEALPPEPAVVATYGRPGGRQWRVYADGSDDYCGEDDLTAAAIDNAATGNGSDEGR